MANKLLLGILGALTAVVIAGCSHDEEYKIENPEAANSPSVGRPSSATGGAVGANNAPEPSGNKPTPGPSRGQ